MFINNNDDFVFFRPVLAQLWRFYTRNIFFHLKFSTYIREQISELKNCSMKYKTCSCTTHAHTHGHTHGPIVLLQFVVLQCFYLHVGSDKNTTVWMNRSESATERNRLLSWTVCVLGETTRCTPLSGKKRFYIKSLRVLRLFLFGKKYLVFPWEREKRKGWAREERNRDKPKRKEEKHSNI